MPRKNFTLTEMLTVIAIISILAALTFPTLNYARQRARRTSCVNNQGQVMKIIQTAMDKKDGMFYSGNKFSAPTEDVDDDEGWTSYLAKKNLLTTLDAFRCPGLQYQTNSKELTKESLQEAYGVVYTSANKGRLNFKGSRLSTSDDTEIAPNALMIGACTVKDKKMEGNALLVKNGGFTNKFAEAHLGDVNVFFRDCSVQTLSKNVLDSGVYYYPSQDKNDDEDEYGKAVKITVSDNNWQKN
ncbi:MAG: prepilin-type N-terminal cleavage/methylation domain-containing protein [Lentisphaeria bacterium]|nr:prepilin-type N-terminal cleavage/methylation domain-containing protein [Lentisphaeria bacterium]